MRKLRLPAEEPAVIGWGKMVWVFAVFSVFGALYEQLFILIENVCKNGTWVWESRAGMVWGPFAPIYGAGAVLMVVFLTWRELKPWQVFVGAALIGGSFEFAVGYIQNHVFHTISWDYSNQFMNFGGYTSLQVMLIWGLMGLLMIEVTYPALEKAVGRLLEIKAGRIVTLALAVFLLIDGALTGVALERREERLEGRPATSVVEQFCDWAFPNDYLERQVPNMMVKR